MTDPNRADLELHVAYRFAATNEPRVGQVPGPLNEDGTWKWVDPPRTITFTGWRAAALILAFVTVVALLAAALLLLALAVGG